METGKLNPEPRPVRRSLGEGGTLTPRQMKTTDVIIIGGGPGGYVAALKSAMLGASVTLIERDAVGGTCLNRGCIPTKTYLHNAEIIHHIHQAASRGILLADANFTIDLAKAVATKNAVVTPLVAGIKGLLRSRKVALVAGNATLINKNQVQVGEETYEATKGIILATGSSPARPPIKGIDLPNVLTSDEMLNLTEMPKELVIIGAGVIGIEMAQIFSAYNVKVTVVEAEQTITPFIDAECATVLRALLEKRGITFLTGQKVMEIASRKQGLSVLLASGEPLSASHVLVAVGRKPNVEALGALAIEKERGFIRANAQMQTSASGVYAVGDVTGKSMLAHAAAKMGEVAAENIMGHVASFDGMAVPGCIYGSPEVGWIGMTEAQAKEKIGEIKVSRFPFAANGRAKCAGQSDGFIKIVSEPKHQAILGVHIVGPLASELINEAVALRAAEVTCEEWADMIHAHPTHAETMMEAAAGVLDRCLHLPPAKG
ncbi:MAG: dihydrolipoyl dehydrogenase [bacterium]